MFNHQTASVAYQIQNFFQKFPSNPTPQKTCLILFPWQVLWQRSCPMHSNIMYSCTLAFSSFNLQTRIRNLLLPKWPPQFPVWLHLELPQDPVRQAHQNPSVKDAKTKKTEVQSWGGLHPQYLKGPLIILLSRGSNDNRKIANMFCEKKA